MAILLDVLATHILFSSAPETITLQGWTGVAITVAINFLCHIFFGSIILRWQFSLNWKRSQTTTDFKVKKKLSYEHFYVDDKSNEHFSYWHFYFTTHWSFFQLCSFMLNFFLMAKIQTRELRVHEHDHAFRAGRKIAMDSDFFRQELELHLLPLALCCFRCWELSYSRLDAWKVVQSWLVALNVASQEHPHSKIQPFLINPGSVCQVGIEPTVAVEEETSEIKTWQACTNVLSRDESRPGAIELCKKIWSYTLEENINLIFLKLETMLQ